MKKPSPRATLPIAKPIKPKPKTIGQLMLDDGFNVRRPKEQSAKAIADRAEATAAMTRRGAERLAKVAEGIDVKSAPDPISAAEYERHASAWISGATDPLVARNRFATEKQMRDRLNVSAKQTRLLKAGLDGRCRRLGEPS